MSNTEEPTKDTAQENAVTLDNVKEVVEEVVAKYAETNRKFQTAANFSESAEDKAKLEAHGKYASTVKFLRAMYDGDLNTVQSMHNVTAKALRESSNAAGGYLVPTEFSTMINMAIDDYSELRREATVLPMSSNVMKLNELTGKVTVYKTAELVNITASQPTYGEPVLTAEKYAASTTMSEELLEDTEINLLQNLGTIFGEQIAYKEQDSFVNSSVSGSEGLLRVSGVNAINMITGTTFTQITWDDLAAMHKEAFEYNKAEAQRGKFYMSMTAYNALRTLKASTGGEYFLPLAPSQAAVPTAWGLPIVVLNEFPTTTATATKFVLFGDLKKHLFIGDRRGIRVRMNTTGTSADGTNLNTQDASELSVTKRTAQVVSLPGGLVTLATN